MCLTKVQKRRLDGFQARGLRRILGIPPAYVSRVSNAEVLRQAGALALSLQIETAQLHLYGRLARLPYDSPLRALVFQPGGVEPVPAGLRRRGRPRLRWVEVLTTAALKTAGSAERLRVLLSNGAGAAEAWERAVARRSVAPTA